jgi:hypothetical protein
MSESNFLESVINTVFSDDGVISEFSDDLYYQLDNTSFPKSRFRTRLNLSDSPHFTYKFRTRHR